MHDWTAGPSIFGLNECETWLSVLTAALPLSLQFNYQSEAGESPTHVPATHTNLPPRGHTQPHDNLPTIHLPTLRIRRMVSIKNATLHCLASQREKKVQKNNNKKGKCSSRVSSMKYLLMCLAEGYFSVLVVITLVVFGIWWLIKDLPKRIGMCLLNPLCLAIAYLYLGVHSSLFW